MYTMVIEERFRQVIEYFKGAMPEAKTELDYTNPYELLVAVILSAQCTDKRVNMITPKLFEAYPTVEHLAATTAEDVFTLIRSCSYPNNKSIHLVEMAKGVVERFGGEVPSTMEELITLAGVGRKTANVILSVVFEKPAMAVDTHVFRVAARIGLTEGAKNPLEAERQLVAGFPQELLPLAHHWLILHGRYVCIARKPKCAECGLQAICKEYFEKKR